MASFAIDEAWYNSIYKWHFPLTLIGHQVITWTSIDVLLNVSLRARFNAILTHCGLSTPYGDINLGQHYLRKWLSAWRHQAIIRTKDLSSVKSSGIHLRVILQEIPQVSVTEISLTIAYLKFCSNIPGANELNRSTKTLSMKYSWRS